MQLISDFAFQGRLFSYADTHLHRLGTNHLLIPVNNPETNPKVRVCTYQRDGAMQTGHNQGQTFFIKKINELCFLGNAPNYYRNSYNGPEVTNRTAHLEHATFESGMAARFDASDDDNYSQPRVFYQVGRIFSLLQLESTRLLSFRKFWMKALDRV